VARQIKYEWDYLYGSLDVVGGQAHFCQIPAVNQEWDRRHLEDLAMTDQEAIHVLIRDQAGFHLRDGDARLPARVRIIDLPPYCPELNPCEQLWDLDRLPKIISGTRHKRLVRLFEPVQNGESLVRSSFPILKSVRSPSLNGPWSVVLTTKRAAASTPFICCSSAYRSNTWCATAVALNAA
jgi:hypothetical protein